MLHWNFGLAWIAFALALALHAADEAAHGFPDVYNPNALAIRRRLHVPIPLFTLRGFILTLASSVCVLLMLSPLALHEVRWVRIAAVPIGLIAGILNGFLHMGASLLYRRKMAGVLTSPLLLAGGAWLLWSCCRI
jgi:hypothetical protein